MGKGAKKRITIEDLATITAKGFESTATKEDLRELEQKLTKEIEGVKDQLVGTNKRIDSLAETKVSKIAFKELENRVGVVEKN